MINYKFETEEISLFTFKISHLLFQFFNFILIFLFFAGKKKVQTGEVKSRLVAQLRNLVLR